MNYRITSSVALATLLTLAGCAKNEPPGKAPAPSVATVNGKPISTALFDAYTLAVARRPTTELTPEQRSQVLDALVNMQLATDTGEKNGTAQKDDIALQLTLARMNVLSDAVIKKYLEDHPTTDAELKAEYETQVASVGREYHARHILVESRAAADDLIAQLNKGADFAKLAEKNSKDGSAKSGGDLGWFNLKTMVPQFSNAVSTLEKGKYTAAPVQTQFGWHIIKLEDTRSSNPPAFDDVKDQVKNLVQRKKAQAYLEELRKAAKIEKTSEPEKAASAQAAPAATEKGSTP